MLSLSQRWQFASWAYCRVRNLIDDALGSRHKQRDARESRMRVGVSMEWGDDSCRHCPFEYLLQTHIRVPSKPIIFSDGLHN